MDPDTTLGPQVKARLEAYHLVELHREGLHRLELGDYRTTQDLLFVSMSLTLPSVWSSRSGWPALWHRYDRACRIYRAVAGLERAQGMSRPWVLPHLQTALTQVRADADTTLAGLRTDQSREIFLRYVAAESTLEQVWYDESPTVVGLLGPGLAGGGLFRSWAEGVALGLSLDARRRRWGTVLGAKLHGLDSAPGRAREGVLGSYRILDRLEEVLLQLLASTEQALVVSHAFAVSEPHLEDLCQVLFGVKNQEGMDLMVMPMFVARWLETLSEGEARLHPAPTDPVVMDTVVHMWAPGTLMGHLPALVETATNVLV